MRPVLVTNHTWEKAEDEIFTKPNREHRMVNPVEMN